MKSFLLISVLLSSVTFTSLGQEKIKWMDMEEALIMNSKNQKKVMVFIYTSWCGYCKKMKLQTFSDSSIASYINNNYYAVKLDAEMKEDIILGNTTYRNISRGNRNYQELALQLMDDNTFFPTTVFLNEKNQKLPPVPGFADASTFKKILHYYSEDFYKTTPWDDYTYKE